jgi:competence protein ComEA
MRRFVMVASAALLLVSLITKSRTSQDIPDRAAFRILSTGSVLVKISGDVRNPGIYNLSANSLAECAIKMAMPSTPLSPPQNSLATASLSNGSAVTLMLQPDGLQSIIYGVMTVPERLVLGIPLDIKTMNESDFDRLPGIGPALARRIIEYRQNNGGILQAEDLNMVEGIGEKKYKILKAYF